MESLLSENNRNMNGAVCRARHQSLACRGTYRGNIFYLPFISLLYKKIHKMVLDF